MALLQKFRQWLDGWEEQPDQRAVPVQSEAQDFAVKLVRELDKRLRQEVLILPDGPAVVPLGWLIFLSSADDRVWQGLKRRALEQWLTRILLERTQSLLPTNETAASPRLDLRIDPTLPPGDFKVFPLWDQSTPLLVLPESRRPA